MNNALFANPAIFNAYQQDPGMAYGQALMQQGASTAPVRSPLEGLARALTAGVGGFTQSRVHDKYAKQDESYRNGLAEALKGGDVLGALQASKDPTLQDMALQMRLRQQMNPADDPLVQVVDPATGGKKFVKQSEAAGQQSDFAPQTKAPQTRQIHRNGMMVDQEFDPATGQFKDIGQGPQFAPNQQPMNEFGLQPFYTKDKDGKLHAWQLSKGGTPHEVAIPEGQIAAPQVQFLDTGTGAVPMNTRTGEPVQGAAPIPKDVAGVQQQQTVGTAVGTAAANLPAITDSANNALSQIDSLLADPNLGAATGKSGVMMNWIPGSGAKDIATKIDQLKGGVFLQAYSTLKGAGAITDIEGRKASDALARLDTAQSDEAFVQALNDYKAVIQQGMTRLKNMSQGNLAPGGQTAPEGKTYNYDAQGNLIQ